MVDPGELLQKEMQKNFPLFGNKIRKQGTYNSVALPITDYDPSDGTYTQDPPTVVPNLWVIFGSASSGKAYDSKHNADEVVLGVDKSILIPQLDLPVKPKRGDTFVENATGITWTVRSVKIDPADALWKLHVRPSDVP